MTQRCLVCGTRKTMFDCFAEDVEWEIEAKEAHEAAEEFALLLSPSVREIQHGQWEIIMAINDKYVERFFEVTVIYTGYHCSASAKLISSKRIK